MGMFSNFMGQIIFFIVLSFLFIPISTHLESAEKGFISVTISSQGLDFVKDLLIHKAISAVVPLQLPQIEKNKKIPLVGKVAFVLFNITIDRVDIASSRIETGETGIVLLASGATANLSMNWKYSYKSWLGTISDNGVASVQVEDMQVGLSVALANQEGTLSLSLFDSGCYVEDISIKLDGGASWLYQGIVDAFGGQITSAVEDAISTKIGEGIRKLDSLLQSLPKEIPVDDNAALNVTFVDDPLLSNSSIEFEINGLFTVTDKVVVLNYIHQISQAFDSCNYPAKMVGISINENVLNSASIIYFDADYMKWTVDEISGQFHLNTAELRYIIPQLYKLYPNDDMNLDIAAASPPIILIPKNDIDATIPLDVTINVLDAGEVIPVACISLVIQASCFAEISGNNLAGKIQLNDFTMSLKWSKIGSLHLNLVRPFMWTVLKNVFLPYVNLHLKRGFPLPILHGFELKNAEILCNNSVIMICSDAAFSEQYHLNQLQVY